MSRAGAEAAEETNRLTPGGPGAEEPDAEARRSRRVLRAVEAYKAACAADGKEPTEAENWLVLLAAVNAPLD